MSSAGFSWRVEVALSGFTSSLSFLGSNNRGEMAPENTGAPVSAEDARNRGNELYRQGNLAAAEVEYKKAARLAPDDPAPLSNLSSVKFEQAQYRAASEYIAKALKLATDVGTDEAAVRKRKTLYERLAKCYMHESRFDEARKVVDEISDENLGSAVRATLDAAAPWRSDNLERHRKMVLDRLPRYQAHLDDEAEYYAIGHDEPESLFDESLQKTCSSRDSVSLMFCGSGDARNLFATLLSLSVAEFAARKSICKDIHITILDLKPAAVARTLIFFDMMMMYVILKTSGTPGIEDAPAVMAYLYAGHVIPAAVHEKLQRHIKGLIEALEGGEKIFDWLFVPTSTRKEVAYVLRQWQKPLEANYYRAPTVRRAVGKILKADRAKAALFFGDMTSREDLPGFEQDRKTFDELTILLPSKAFAESRDPPLVALMQQYYEGGSQDAANRLADYVDANWVTNLTLIDFDHIESTRRGDRAWALTVTDEEKVPSIAADSVQLAGMLPHSAGGVGALEAIGNFFGAVSVMLAKLSPRLMIEALVGEMTDTMDRLRWHCLDSRSQPLGGIDPSRFPRTYDRIHMSNIPDYVGGLFTAAMYGRPLLREDKPSNLRFTVLLNPPMFSSHGHFQAEYLLMHDEQHISDHFSLVRIPEPATAGKHDDERKAALFAALGVSGMKDFGAEFMAEGYLVWERCPARKLLRGKDMLPRTKLEKWLYSVFLKICLPYPRGKHSDKPVYSPLNLTALMRLVSHLAEIGYPAHWLSGVVSALCARHITTTARPPRREATTPADVDATFPALEMIIASWSAEFTTILSIWSRLLPFGFIAPPGAVVPPAEIAEFSVTFPVFEDKETQLRVPHFVLLFWNATEGDAPPCDGSLSRFLRDDETGDRSAPTRVLKGEAVNIFTAMKFVTATRTASFWCRADVMQRMRDEGWEVFIWRTDTWTRVTDGVSVKHGVTLKGLWKQ